MKSTQVTTDLKKQYNLSTNDEIIPTIENTLLAARVVPIGAVVLISGLGDITATPINLDNPTVAHIDVLQRALRKVADMLDQQKMDLVRREVESQRVSADAPEGDEIKRPE